MKTLPTVFVFVLSVAPFWFLANDIGGDEVKKTLGSAAIVGAGLGIRAIKEMHDSKKPET